MVDRDLDLVVSPELVLVSPDLRQRALLKERAVPPRWYAAPAARPPAAPATATASNAPAIDVRRHSPLEATLLRTVGFDPPPPEKRPLTVGFLTVMVLASLVVFGAGLSVGRLALPSSASSTTAAVPRGFTRPSTVATTARERPKPSLARSVSKPAATPRAIALPRLPAQTAATRQPGTHEASVRSLPHVAARPLPNGGYVLRDGHFRVSGDARLIVDFTLDSSCGSLVLPPISVGTDAAFTFDGHPPGSPAGTTVKITGRFVSPREAEGTTLLTGAACRVAGTGFVARLS